MTAPSQDQFARSICLLALALTGCGFTPGRLQTANSDAAGEDGDASPEAVAPDAAVRVSDGLVALYTFEDGAGSTVADRSGVDPALDLTIADPANVTWGDGTLTIVTQTLIASPLAATKVLDACRGADALTLEAWLTPSILIDTPFPRVVTLSASNSDLAATLMAIDSHFEFRMLGPMTDSNGLPSLNTPDNTVALMAVHVVLVSESGGMRRIYVDGVERATDNRGGDLASWGMQHRLGLGNEIDGGRPWFGTFDLVAIYARALTPMEIAQNRAVGPR